MALTRSRLRQSVVGIGRANIRETEPSVGAAMLDLGYLEFIDLLIESDMEDFQDATGYTVNRLTRTRKVSGVITLSQVGADEIDLIRNAAEKVYALNFYGLVATGMFHFWAFDVVRLDPKATISYKPEKRTLQLPFTALRQNDLSYSVPEEYFYESAGVMTLGNIGLFVDPARLLNVSTLKILDMSGFARHGTVNAAGVWTAGTPAYFLRFDGTDDCVTFGDVLDEDSTGDYMIEAWVRVHEADGGAVPFVVKKAAVDGNDAGFALYRNSSNQLVFSHGDGDSVVTIASVATVLHNTWKHVAVVVDRNGNASLYVNGALSGTPGSVASQTTGANAVDLYLARVGTTYGEVDMGAVRIHRWGAGELPSTIATIVASHYAAEAASYGL
jgi:hypothetical protein